MSLPAAVTNDRRADGHLRPAALPRVPARLLDGRRDGRDVGRVRASWRRCRVIPTYKGAEVTGAHLRAALGVVMLALAGIVIWWVWGAGGF
jgi:hypothetical protein